MHEQRSPCVADDDATEQAIIGMLLSDSGPPIWALEELVGEIGDRLATVDALSRLVAAGIVHSLGGEFVFIGRTARRTLELWDYSQC